MVERLHLKDGGLMANDMSNLYDAALLVEVEIMIVKIADLSGIDYQIIEEEIACPDLQIALDGANSLYRLLITGAARLYLGGEDEYGDPILVCGT